MLNRDNVKHPYIGSVVPIDTYELMKRDMSDSGHQTAFALLRQSRENEEEFLPVSHLEISWN